MIHSQMIVLINLQAVGQDAASDSDAASRVFVFCTRSEWQQPTSQSHQAFAHIYTNMLKMMSLGQLPLAHIDKHISGALADAQPPQIS